MDVETVAADAHVSGEPPAAPATPAATARRETAAAGAAPRVLVVIGDNLVTGPVKGVLRLVADLHQAGAEVTLVNGVVDGADASPVAEAGRRHGLAVTELRHGRRAYLTFARQAWTVARAHRVSIVQTHGYKQAVAGAYLKYRCGLKWVCFLHGRTTEDRKARLYHHVETLVQRLADRTVVVSDAQRNHLGGSSRVRVIPNAVDAANPARVERGRGPTRAALGLDDATPLVLVLGRLSPEKGVDVFLEAFAVLPDRHARVRAAIVGDGPLRSQLEARTQALGLADRVAFTGHTAHPGDYLLAADLVALPSRSEGMPNAVLEAMAFGKPVVATRVGGVGEIIDDGETGLLVGPESPAALAAALDRVLADSQLAHRLGRAAAERVRDHFSPAARLSAVTALYREVLAGA